MRECAYYGDRATCPHECAGECEAEAALDEWLDRLEHADRDEGIR